MEAIWKMPITSKNLKSLHILSEYKNHVLQKWVGYLENLTYCNSHDFSPLAWLATQQAAEEQKMMGIWLSRLHHEMYRKGVVNNMPAN